MYWTCSTACRRAPGLPSRRDQLLLSTVFANRSIGPQPRLDDDARLLLNLADFATSADITISRRAVSTARALRRRKHRDGAAMPSPVLCDPRRRAAEAVRGPRQRRGGKSLLAKLTAKLDWLAEPTAATSRDIAELRRSRAPTPTRGRRPRNDPEPERRGGPVAGPQPRASPVVRERERERVGRR